MRRWKARGAGKPNQLRCNRLNLTEGMAKIAETPMTQPTNARLAWFNGKFIPESQVLISFRDRSWKYGDGAFDMTRTFNGRAFRLKEHVDRFYRTLRYLRLDPGISRQDMIDVALAPKREPASGAKGPF